MPVQSSVSSISKSCTTAVDSDSNTADKVAHSNSDACPEEREASVVRVGGDEGGTLNSIDLGGEDNGHDDAVDGNDLAEDNGDQVLGADTGCSNTTSEDGGTGNEDAPERKRRCQLAPVEYAREDLSCPRILIAEDRTYHAAPTTERPMHNAIPRLAHV